MGNNVGYGYISKISSVGHVKAKIVQYGDIILKLVAYAGHDIPNSEICFYDLLQTNFCIYILAFDRGGKNLTQGSKVWS